MLTRLIVFLFALGFISSQALAVTINFGGGSDDENTVAFNFEGISFTASGNDGRLINQSGAGLGLAGALPGDPDIEGRRIAGPEVLTITFDTPVFIQTITFAEFNGLVEPVGVLVNGSVQVSDNLVNGVGIELAVQAGTPFGNADPPNDSFQEFLFPFGGPVSTFAITGQAANGGNRGILLDGFTAEIVPLPTPIVLSAASIAAFGFVGYRRRKLVARTS
ncbi:MAG: hypothetical protein AAGC81_12180 [Pseudomonadota bacterium]